MGELFSNILLVSPVFLASPTMYAAAIFVLGSEDRPKARALAILAGSAVTVAVIGYLALQAAGQVSSGPSPKPSKLSGTVDLLLGAVLIVLAFRMLFHSRGTEHDGPEAAGHKRRVGSAPAGRPRLTRDVILGLLVTVTNPTSLASYFTVAKQAADSGLGSTAQVTAMAAAGLLFVTPVLLPLTISVAAPKTSEKILAAVGSWFRRYSSAISAFLLAVIGVVLLTKGAGIPT